MSRACEFLLTTWDHGQIPVGRIVLDGDELELQPLKGYKAILDSVKKTEAYIGGKKVTAKDNPAKWFKNLPTQYDGIALRARMMSSEETKKTVKESMEPFKPQDGDRIPMRRTFTKAQFEKIKHGFVPKDFDDRWFIFYEKGWLYFHRSWTGSCFFQVRLKRQKRGYAVSEAWGKRNPRKHRSANLDDEAPRISMLIDHLLLKRNSKSGPPPS